MSLPTTPLAQQPWTDEQVIERVRAGEVQFFELLMRRHNERIYRAVRSILRDEAAVEDVMQSAYLQAFAHLAEFQSRAQFATWLTRIAMNEALAHRRRARWTVPEDGATMIHLAGTGPSPAEATLDEEHRRILARAIDALPEHFRTVFVLRQVQELSVEETAGRPPTRTPSLPADAMSFSESLVEVHSHRTSELAKEARWWRTVPLVEPARWE